MGRPLFSFQLFLLAGLLCDCREGRSARPAGAAQANGRPLVDEVALRCARIASCADANDPPSLRTPTACVDWWWSHSGTADSLAICLRSADTCGAVAACMHAGHDSRAAAYCVAHPTVLTTCEGDDLIECSGADTAESTVVHCASLGARCGERHTAGGLLVRGCLSPECSPDVTSVRCEGPGTVVSCDEGMLSRSDCPAGTVCFAHAHEDGASFAMCEGAGHNECNRPESARCDGDRLIECQAHGHFGHERITDCRAQGLACTGAGHRAACMAAAECAPGPARCEGNALLFCAAGRLERVPCSRIGLGACNPDARGGDAACAIAKGAAVR